jgi:hypothetical protein
VIDTLASDSPHFDTDPLACLSVEYLHSWESKPDIVSVYLVWI